VIPTAGVPRIPAVCIGAWAGLRFVPRLLVISVLHHGFIQLVLSCCLTAAWHQQPRPAASL